MKIFFIIIFCFYLPAHLFSQNIDTLSNEKKIREKILTDIQISFDKKTSIVDSTIRKIDSKVDKIDSLLKTTTSSKEKADKLLERVQVIEDKQKALEETEFNIYQANYQSAIINLLSMEREIKPLVLFNTTKVFFDELGSVNNPATYPDYQEWFKKFKEYIQKNKKNDVSLRALNNFITMSEAVSASTPLTGVASQMMFTGMSSYINTIAKREKELKTQSENMFSLMVSLSQLKEDKDKIDHEWELITVSLQKLKDYYEKVTNRNFNLIGISKDDFINNFSNQNDADKRYLYLSSVRTKTANYVYLSKNNLPKEWKEKIYYELSDIQVLKLKYGEITTQINHHISQYETLIKKFKNDKNIAPRMELLDSKLSALKETFDKAFEPAEYTNSIYRMYKVQ
ncbi:MAG: hypothetical protein K2Q21_02750 [Chitinophagaceae bacterium]|nr:hypothetical protein [Chitinophagaceae bacterium]